MLFKVIGFVFSVVLFSSTVYAKTYDFSNRNTGTKAFAYDDDELPTNNIFLSSSELTDYAYTAISIPNDGRVYSLSTIEKGDYSILKYVFELDEAETDIDQLDFFWKGIGINSNPGKESGVILYIWDDSNVSYERITTSAGSLTHTITENVINYIDVNKKFTLLVVSKNPKQGNHENKLSVDYVSVQVNTTPILSRDDGILGGQLQSDNFVIGSIGSGSNQWPNDELPENLIDGEGQKYLNFGKLYTGALITPAIGCSIVDTIKFWTANDNESRDPARYKLYGTNSRVSGLSHPLSDFTLLSEDNLSLPASRNADGDSDLENDNSQTISFVNTTSYTSYLLYFPTVKDSDDANSMQLSEVQLYGSTNSCSPMEVIAGRVTLKNTNTIEENKFTSVCFDTAFTEVPRVFSMPTTADNADRLALRIRNVTTTGFEIAQVESAGNSPSGNVSQTIDFLAIPDGDYSLDGGAEMRVSALSTKKFQGKRVSATSWETVSTTDVGFSQFPAIIASIQTMENETNPIPISSPFLATAIKSVTRTGFKMALERGETRTGSLNSNETIAYIAITPGKNGQLTDDISYESFRTLNNVTGINSCSRVNLNGNYSSGNPLVIASQNTRDGADGGWVKRCAISTSRVGFSIVEDMANDRDQNHTDERVGGIALGGAFTNQTCNVAPDNVHHYEISHDGHGLTCDAESITIKACSNESCSSSDLSTESVTLDVLADGNKIISSLTFTGSTTVSFNHTTAEILTLSVADASVTPTNALICDGGSGNPCDMVFADTGFQFTSSINSDGIPTQLSGKPSNKGYNSSTLSLQAIKTSPVTGACEAAFVGSTPIELSAKCIDPAICKKVVINGTNINVASINGSSISTLDAASPNTYSPISLDFGDETDNTAEFTFKYPDAGKVQLHARYKISVDGSSAVDYMQGSSNSFVVRPFGFHINADGNEKAVDANGLAYKKAGEEFATSVTAVQWQTGQDNDKDGIPDSGRDLSNNKAAPNFGQESTAETVILTHQLAAPSGGSLGSLSGNTITSFTSGKGQTTNLSWSEVGIIDLTANLSSSSYLDAGAITGTIPYVGRFIPAYFKQTIKATSGNVLGDEGSLTVNHNNDVSECRKVDWAYSGQLTDLGSGVQGSIRYSTPPKLTITAYNNADQITTNYTGDFAKLMDLKGDANNKIIFKTPHSDDRPLTRSFSELGVIDDLGHGVLTYQLSAQDHFVYTRDENSKAAPFQAAFELPFEEFQDSDEVTFKASGAGIDYFENPKFHGTSDFNNTVEIRFGRLVLKNSFGPETSDLIQPMEVQYYDDNNFVVSTDDNCSSYDKSKIALTNISLDPKFTEALGGTGNFFAGKTREIKLKAPGVGNKGDIRVEYEAYDWLKYDWANENDGLYDENPSAVATFGLFGGNDRVIYKRRLN